MVLLQIDLPKELDKKLKHRMIDDDYVKKDKLIIDLLEKVLE